MPYRSDTGSSSPAGSNTQLQFNNGGSFGASDKLTFNESSGALNLTGSLAITRSDADYAPLAITQSNSSGPALTFNTTSGSEKTFDTDGAGASVKPVAGPDMGTWTHIGMLKTRFGGKTYYLPAYRKDH